MSLPLALVRLADAERTLTGPALVAEQADAWSDLRDDLAVAKCASLPFGDCRGTVTTAPTYRLPVRVVLGDVVDADGRPVWSAHPFASPWDDDLAVARRIADALNMAGVL